MEMVDKQNWNKFILENNGSFLQSFEWGEFQECVGRRVFRFQSDEWAVQFIEYKLPLGKKYWYCPRAPLLGVQSLEFKVQSLKELIKIVGESARKEGILFFRIGPEWEIGQGIENNLKKSGFRQISYDIEPSQTLVLEITKPEEELLAQMHEKWRYNIRLAERKGVKVKMVKAGDGDFEKYFDEFYRLVDKGTSERKGIRHHAKDYYKKQLEIGKNYSSSGTSEASGVEKFSLRQAQGKLSSNNNLKTYLFIAEYEGKVIAANIVAIFGQTATYLHGATSDEHRGVMAPHLLQWEQIKYARQQGCAEYDFFGISNEHTRDRRGKSWEGFTRFKKGFGGREENYVGYFDWPLEKFWYFIYRLVQGFRR